MCIHRTRKSFRSASLADKFFHYVGQKQPNGCIHWKGKTDRCGYGFLAKTKKTKYFTAHRLSYELLRGPIPEGMKVCHSCDNPACVNPSHLFLGSQRDNMIDMRRKGRGNALWRGGRLGKAGIQFIL